MSKKKKKQPNIPKDIPKCPFCGRRITVKKLEPGLYNCDYCDKMFQDEHKQ